MNSDTGDLSKLQDIVLPSEPGWWPPAPGWFLLALLLLAALIVGAVRASRSWRANAYRREAGAALEIATTPAEIAAILRRTALAISPRQEIATLTGVAWTRWLAARFPQPLPEAIAQQLLEAPYRTETASTDTSLRELRQFAADWIRLHQAQTKPVTR